jgi:hypothetical protein
VMKHLRTSSFGEIQADKFTTPTCSNAVMDVRSRATSMF